MTECNKCEGQAIKPCAWEYGPWESSEEQRIQLMVPPPGATGIATISFQVRTGSYQVDADTDELFGRRIVLGFVDPQVSEEPFATQTLGSERFDVFYSSEREEVASNGNIASLFMGFTPALPIPYIGLNARKYKQLGVVILPGEQQNGTQNTAPWRLAVSWS